MSISRINNNVAALNANFNVARTGRDLEKSIERLSSGLRINRAGDDAAGLTVATRLRTQTRGLDRAVMNAQDGINLVNVAEGALEEMTSRLDRIRVLAIQAGNTGVNDVQARQALQDEVFQSIDEISRIADATQYSKNRLLNGTFAVDARIKPGQDGKQNYGIKIDGGPSSNTLESGVHYLNIVKTKDGFQQLIAGLDNNGISQTMHAGVQNATDLAVSMAYFTSGRSGLGGTALGAGNIASNFFNGVSVARGDVVTFEGVLSDGVTKFTGAVSTVLSTGTTLSLAGLVSTINSSINNAETSVFGSATVPTSFQTDAVMGTTGANTGRILLKSSSEVINQSSLSVRIIRNGTLLSQAVGVTRSGEIGTNSVLKGQGQVGNNVAAITGSTFTSGEFEIAVEDVQGAQARQVDGTVIFRDHTGNLIGRTTSLTHTSRGLQLNGTFVNGTYTGGVSISNGDTITMRGVEADGTTFQTTYTFANQTTADTNLVDFQFSSLSGLISEMNYRTRFYGTGNGNNGKLTRFETGLFTLSSKGVLTLVDDLGRDNSQLSFTLTFNDSTTTPTPAYTITDRAELIREGFSESATIRVNGGDAVRAKAGDVITAYGPPVSREGEVQGEVTFRVGSNLKVGTDILKVEGQEFVGSLNGGPAVTFQNGAQDVVFIDDGSLKSGVARVLQVDFDGILDITKNPDDQDPGTTILISVINHSVNFQIGAFAKQNFRTSIGDLRSDVLGFGKGSGRTVQDINITSVSGVNEALSIVDEALDQINRTRSLLGAATNRLEGTIANLSVASENLQASESRLRDADIALESSKYAQNQVLLQAGVSVLAQANFLPQSFLSLLG
ncbi:MAG: hypothetical protein GC154_21340 [bacterium]|nr:hypothetical protein [bacterium]